MSHTLHSSGPLDYRKTGSHDVRVPGYPGTHWTRIRYAESRVTQCRVRARPSELGGFIPVRDGYQAGSIPKAKCRVQGNTQENTPSPSPPAGDDFQPRFSPPRAACLFSSHTNEKKAALETSRPDRYFPVVDASLSARLHSLLAVAKIKFWCTAEGVVLSILHGYLDSAA